MTRPLPSWLPAAAAYALAALAANLLVALYIGHERAIYYWDYANYWNQYDHYTRLFQASPREALRQLIGSVKYSEYNGIAAFLLTPFGLLFGTGRLSYVLAVTNLYALPAAAASAWAFSALRPAEPGGAAPPRFSPAAFWLFGLCAALWHPVLRGFETVGALIPSALLLGLWLRQPVRAWSWRTALVAGLLLASLVLFRRIFAYWVIGFAVAAFAVDVLPLFLDRSTRREALRATLRLAASGALLVSALFVFAGPMSVAMVKNDYRALYRMYLISQTLPDHLAAALRYFGAPLALLALVGAGLALKRPATQRPALFFLLQLTVTFVAFTRVQDFHRHHYYLLLPGLVALALLALAGRGRSLAAGGVALMGIGSTLAFVPALSGLPLPVFRLLGPSLAYPFHRGDLPELARLLSDLDRIPGATDPLSGVYVLASSDVINDEMLRAARRVLPATRGAPAVLRPTANKDAATFGFPRDLLRAEVLVVADPPQLHLAGENAQAVIRAPLQALRDPAGFGGAYTESDSVYALDQGVRVTLRTRRPGPFSPGQLASLRETFLRLHPQGASEPYDFTPPVGRAP